MSMTVKVILLFILLLQQATARKCPLGEIFIKDTCLKRCSEVCPFIKLPCEPFLDMQSSPYNVSSWIAAENVPCFQREYDQLTGNEFFRTSCRCPDRIYTNTSNPGTLSNCILSAITETELEINVGQLSSVQLGIVTADRKDIDFQGDTNGNLICMVDTAEDLEFGSSTKFSYNIIENLVVGDDLQFEPGVVVGPYNVFKRVTIRDKFRFVDDIPQDVVKVVRNYWGTLIVDECEIETDTEPIFIQNICSEVTVDKLSSCLISPIMDGLSCLPK